MRLKSKNLGYSSAELAKLTPFDIKPEFSKELFSQLIMPLINGTQQMLHFETIHQRKNGSTYPVEVYLQYSHFKGQPVFVAFILDITIRSKTEEQLRRAQKMEAIGQLTGGIAHDFNNLLGIIIGNLGFLKRMDKENEKSLKRIDAANTAALRAVDLTQQLLGFSRKQEHILTTTDLNQVIHDVDTLIARSVTPQISVEYFLIESPYLTDIDPAAFKDVLLNLILNARDAMPCGGTLSIETNNKTLDQHYAALHPDVKPGDYVEFSVSDTGTGMYKDELEHIFEPFYTTKPQGKGTGLGLSMVFGFISRSHGHIKVYSDVGIGTTFHLFLPRSRNTMVQNNNDISTEEIDLPVGNEVILVVDDEADLLEIAATQLNELGYKTYSAGTAQQAIEPFQQYSTINLLFSDVVMPGGINGYELAEQAENINPKIKLLLTSGHTKKALVKNAQSQLANNLLVKPYSFEELAFSIRKTLDKTRSS